jgi:hypothetical protein
MYATGRPRRVIILGSFVSSSSLMMALALRASSRTPMVLMTVYVRVAAARGPVCLRLVWADDGLAGCELVTTDVRRPGAMRLAPDGEALLGLDLRTLRAVELRVDGDGVSIDGGWGGAGNAANRPS